MRGLAQLSPRPPTRSLPCKLHIIYTVNARFDAPRSCNLAAWKVLERRGQPNVGVGMGGSHKLALKAYTLEGKGVLHRKMRPQE